MELPAILKNTQKALGTRLWDGETGVATAHAQKRVGVAHKQGTGPVGIFRLHWEARM